MVNLGVLVAQCAPLVAPATAHAVVAVESAGNPHAIGVVGGHLVRQPRDLAEAMATVRSLESLGMNYSVGLGQINRANFVRLGLTPESAFEPCANLRAMQAILSECFERAARATTQQQALRQAFSCYYSGNYSTGFREGYVDRVLAAWRANAAANVAETRKESPSATPLSSPSLPRSAP